MFFEVAKFLNAEALILERGAEELGGAFFDDYKFVQLRDIDPQKQGEYWTQKKRLTREIADHCASFRPHLLILGGDFYWPFLPRLAKTSVCRILSIHNMFWQLGQPPKNMRARANRFVKTQLIGRYFDAAVSVSTDALDQFDVLSPKKLPGFVSTHQLPMRLAEPQHGVDPSKRPQRKICFLGRIEHEKGVFDLLEAFQEIARTLPDTRLSFVGDGRALDELRRRIGNSDVSDRVEAKGPVDAAAVYATLRLSSVCVVPTRRAFAEGFPAVCAEAISQQTPLVVSSVVPAKTVFGDAVLEFEAENVKSLSENLQKLLRDDNFLDEMRQAAIAVKPALFDRSKSWGSALAQAILAGVECSAPDRK